VLEQVDAPADRRLRQMQRGGGAGEATMAHDGDEGLDVVQLHVHQDSG
jgi:hypothetical protein